MTDEEREIFLQLVDVQTTMLELMIGAKLLNASQIRDMKLALWHLKEKITYADPVGTTSSTN